MQKWHRDLGPDVRVDDHQQELTLGAQHSCHFRQRSFDAFAIQVNIASTPARIVSRVQFSQ